MHFTETNLPPRQEKQALPLWGLAGIALALLLGGGSLLYFTSGGFPPLPWRLLFETISRFPLLWQSHGNNTILPLTILVIHSLALLSAWISLFLCASSIFFSFRTRLSENKTIPTASYAGVSTPPAPVGVVVTEELALPQAPPVSRIKEERPVRPVPPPPPPIPGLQDDIWPELDLANEAHSIEQPVAPIAEELPAPLQLLSAARSHSGLEKRHLLNEDRIFAQQWPLSPLSLPEPCGLFMVAECSGPASSGLEANQQIIQTASDTLMPALITSIDIERLARQLLQGLQHALITFHLNNTTPIDVGISAILIMGDIAGCIHLGKSQCYLYREQGDRLHLLSSQNLPFAEPDMQIPASPMPLQFFTLQEGDRLLLCSDGLRSNVADEEITYILRNYGSKPSQAVNQLIVRSLQRGGHDNSSAIVVTAHKNKARPFNSPDLFDDDLSDLIADEPAGRSV